MSNLANQFVIAERTDLARGVRVLLAKPLLRAASDPVDFELVRRRKEPLAGWFDYYCGWTLLVRPGYARLVKVRTDPDDTRPARRSRTGRAPFAQLIDVAPTTLQALGLDQPASMNGQPMRATGERPPLEAAVAELEAVNNAATIHHRNTSFFFWTLVIVSAALVGLGILLLGGLFGLPPRRSAVGRHALRTLSIAAAGLPVATYLAGIVPWERAGAPALALSAAVLAADLAVLAVAVGGPWRRHRLGPPLVVLAVTFGTLVCDVLTGSTLELNGLLGYDAIVAGRFTGYGNLSFGLLSVSALLVTAAAPNRPAWARRCCMRSGPITASGKPGKFSTSVVVISAPPYWLPSNTSGARLARAV